MAKKVAVLAANPVNGYSLFQYLEVFLGNGIPYKVFAVADSKEIKIDSDIVLTVDDVVANLEGHEDEYDTLMFAYGDAVPVFRQDAGKPYNITMLETIETFDEKSKVMIGYYAAAMMSDFVDVTKGKRVAVHPLAKPAIRDGEATDDSSEINSNFYTAQNENSIQTMVKKIMAALKA